MRICIVQMGGTIDKVYPQMPNAYGFEIEEAKSIDILNRWRNTDHLEFHTIAKKDSQDLTEEDRSRLMNFLNSNSFDAYLITHGTDTMELTGQFLVENISRGETPIVITGSRLPACVVGSDAPLNLGMSLGVLQSEQGGIYIVIDGNITEVKL